MLVETATAVPALSDEISFPLAFETSGQSNEERITATAILYFTVVLALVRLLCCRTCHFCLSTNEQEEHQDIWDGIYRLSLPVYDR